ncbi:hypothetical protein ACFYVM_16655 [Streptomyces sp. NPDC003280]
MELIKCAARALKERRSVLGWTVASSIISGGIGLLMAAAYLRYR